jgi:hypothetical protein
MYARKDVFRLHYRSVLHFAAYQGANIEDLCLAVGLDPLVLKMPDQRVSAPLHYAVWQEVVKRTGDQNLGLHLGEALSLGNYGIVGYVLLNCHTLAEVFEKFCRYTCLFCQGVFTHFSISEGIIFFECDCMLEVNLN